MKSGNKAVCGAVLALLAGAVAHAGSDEAIARCAEMPSLAERVLCLEDALRRTDPADSGGEAPGTDGRMPGMPAPSQGRAGEREAAKAEAKPPATSDATDDAKTDANAEATTDATTGAPPTRRDAASFGLPESRAPHPSLESIRVTVTAVERNAYGKLRYVTGNGQLWQQIDQRTPRNPDVPFEAEIRTAAAGSFFLQPLSGGIAVRVQRRR